MTFATVSHKKLTQYQGLAKIEEHCTQGILFISDKMKWIKEFLNYSYSTILPFSLFNNEPWLNPFILNNAFHLANCCSE
jgi:hypothetical protein